MPVRSISEKEGGRCAPVLPPPQEKRGEQPMLGTRPLLMPSYAVEISSTKFPIHSAVGVEVMSSLSVVVQALAAISWSLSMTRSVQRVRGGFQKTSQKYGSVRARRQVKRRYAPAENLWSSFRSRPGFAPSVNIS